MSFHCLQSLPGTMKAFSIRILLIALHFAGLADGFRAPVVLGRTRPYFHQQSCSTAPKPLQLQFPSDLLLSEQPSSEVWLTLIRDVLVAAGPGIPGALVLGPIIISLLVDGKSDMKELKSDIKELKSNDIEMGFKINSTMMLCFLVLIVVIQDKLI